MKLDISRGVYPYKLPVAAAHPKYTGKPPTNAPTCVLNLEYCFKGVYKPRYPAHVPSPTNGAKELN